MPRVAKGVDCRSIGFACVGLPVPGTGESHPALSFSDHMAIMRDGAAAARQAHNLEVVGSNPTPAIDSDQCRGRPDTTSNLVSRDGR